MLHYTTIYNYACNSCSLSDLLIKDRLLYLEDEATCFFIIQPIHVVNTRFKLVFFSHVTLIVTFTRETHACRVMTQSYIRVDFGIFRKDCKRVHIVLLEYSHLIPSLDHMDISIMNSPTDIMQFLPG